MPYCPKCGVETDKKIERCPLCDFEIPNVDDIDDNNIERFPEMENVYPHKRKRRINIVFMIISIVLFSAAVILVYNNMHFSGRLTWSRYSSVSLISAWFYIFFFFGFVPDFKKSVVGIGVVTIGLLYFLDSFNGKVDWFYWIGLEAVIAGVVLILFCYDFWKKVKKKRLNILAFVLLCGTVYCLVLESSISLFLHRKIKLLWSVDVAIQIIPLSVLLLIINKVIPDKFILELRKKFHI